MLRVSALLATVLSSCSRPQPIAVGPDPSDAAVIATPQPDTSTPPDADTLPPVDRRCSVDADCDFVALEVSGPQTCCPSCGTTIAARTWTTAVRAICGSKPMPATCPALACPVGPTKSRCDKGTCVPKF